VPAIAASVKLGTLVTVHTTFVGVLSSIEKDNSASSSGYFISVSDNDKSAHVEFLDDSDDNYTDLRTPIGVKSANERIQKLVPLKVFVESGGDDSQARLLVCVKWVRDPTFNTAGTPLIKLQKGSKKTSTSYYKRNKLSLQGL
jgi:hypothetical protein